MKQTKSYVLRDINQINPIQWSPVYSGCNIIQGKNVCRTLVLNQGQNNEKCKLPKKAGSNDPGLSKHRPYVT